MCKSFSKQIHLYTNRWLLSSIGNHLREKRVYRKYKGMVHFCTEKMETCKVAKYSKKECNSVFSADSGKGKSTDITEDNIL